MSATFFLGIRRSWRHMTGSFCANRLKISSLLFSNPCGPIFHDVILGSDNFWAWEPVTCRCLSHLSCADASRSFHASLLVSIFSPLSSLAFIFFPSAPIRASPWAASMVSPLCLILLIHMGMLLPRAVKKSQYAVHDLLGLVVDGSSQILSMSAIASYSPLSINQLRSLSLQFSPP